MSMPPPNPFPPPPPPAGPMQVGHNQFQQGPWPTQTAGHIVQGQQRNVLYPHSDNMTSTWQVCPSPHDRQTQETAIYESYVLRRTRSSPSTSLSWKNKPHIAVQHVSSADVAMLGKLPRNQRHGHTAHALSSYDQLSHTSMRDAVDFVVEERNTREAEGMGWIWQMALIDVQQAPVGKSLFPSRFETTQIRVILKRTLRPGTRRFDHHHDPNFASNVLGPNHPQGWGHLPYPAPPQPGGIAAAPFNDTPQPRNQIANVAWNQDAIANDVQKTVVPVAKHQTSIGDLDEVIRGKSKKKTDGKQKKRTQQRMSPSIDKELRKPYSDSETDDHKPSGRLKHKQKHGAAAAPTQRSHKRPNFSYPQQHRSRSHHHRDGTCSEDSMEDDRSSWDEGAESGSGYLTPPTISDHGSTRRQRSRQSQISGSLPLRGRSHASRHDLKDHFMYPMDPRDFRAVPRVPTPPTQAFRRRHHEAEGAGEREKMAYIAGRRNQRQLDDQMSYSSWPPR